MTIKLEIREEGAFMVAHLVLTHAPDGRHQIGTILKKLVDRHPEVFEGFKTVMNSAAILMLNDVGLKVAAAEEIKPCD